MIAQFLRAIGVVGVLALIGAAVGTGLGRLLVGLGATGETLASVLTVCGGIWSALLLVGMVVTVRGSMGEYFWLGAPVFTAAALGIALTLRSDAEPLTVIVYAALGSVGLYGVAVVVHVLIRKFIAWRRA